MRLALFFCAVLLGTLQLAFAQASIEGRVELPKAKSAPVMAKRYEIVTTGGVLGTNPPLAVVYLEGSFPKPASLPTKQVSQKDLLFVPALLPIRPLSPSTRRPASSAWRSARPARRLHFHNDQGPWMPPRDSARRAAAGRLSLVLRFCGREPARQSVAGQTASEL